VAGQPIGPTGAALAPQGWAVSTSGHQGGPPAAPARPGPSTALIAAVVILVIAGLGVGAYFALRSDSKATVASGSTTEPETTSTTTTSTSTTTTTEPTTTLTSEPPGPDDRTPSEALVRNRFASLISSDVIQGQCAPTVEDEFAFLLCLTDESAKTRVSFWAWSSTKLATYATENPFEPTTVRSKEPWPSAGSSQGTLVVWVNGSNEECRTWNYEDTQFTVQVCSSSADEADAITATFQE
jgi:hypothetical protein